MFGYNKYRVGNGAYFYCANANKIRAVRPVERHSRIVSPSDKLPNCVARYIPLRCSRSELQCEGYDEVVFFDEGPRLERRASGTAGSSPERRHPEMLDRAVLPTTEAYCLQFLVEKLKIGVVGDG